MSRKPPLNGNNTDNPEENIPLDSKRMPEQFQPTFTKKKSLRQSIKDVYYEYCSNTSIHGVQYFGQQRPWIEILFWICIFIVSLYFCTITVTNIYNKWNETPVIVSLSEQSTPIWKIPFPAVTICSETKRPFDKTQRTFRDLCKELAANGANFKPNISSTDLEEFLTLLHVCEETEDDDEEEHHVDLYTHPAIDYFEILNQMLPDTDGSYPFCKWSGKNVDCDELLTKTYTEDGICFTFNGLNATDLYRENTIQYQQMGLETPVIDSEILNRTLSWSMEKGYDADSTLRTFPARVLKSGSKSGLEIGLFGTKENIDYGCSTVQGFKLLLHASHNVPLVSSQFLRIPMNKEIRIAVKPNMMTTSEGIRNYKPEKRKCYMNSERQLKYFKIYSENNCELECLTNYTLKTCGCVHFSMPRTPDMPVCGADKIGCYQNVENELLEQEFFEMSNKIKFSHGGETECNCMPACTSLEYDIEISQGEVDTENALKAHDAEGYEEKFTKNNSTLEASQISIYFKDNEFMTSKRSELYGLSDFLANCGGVLGLFMGFSILSVVEVLYHFSLRLWNNIKRKKELNPL